MVIVADLPEWHIKGFLDEFMRIEKQMPDRAFAFILGAGASRTSGILTGGELVDLWLEELHERAPDPQGLATPLEDWATADQLGIPDFEFDRRSEFYPDIYKVRFSHDPPSGHAYLESRMRHSEPSFGYTVLARILAEKRHKVVVTTNFDSLVADSLFIYTETRPLICGHEELAHYVQVRPRRPLVAKVHRDLFYEPRSAREELRDLPPPWKETLKLLFEHYTPIVIGYGGNDGTLMGFLLDLPPGYIPGGIFWFYTGEEKLRDDIVSLIKKQNGVIVRIPGFDELMLMLSERLGFNLLTAGTVSDRAARRYESYIRQIEVMTEFQDPHHEHANIALSQLLEQIEYRNGLWWYWAYRARHAVGKEEQEKIFREGLKHCGSGLLHSHFANFLTDVCQKFDEAHQEHTKAYQLAPRDAAVIANYATFCAYVVNEPEKATSLFREAIDHDIVSDELLYKYALFLARSEGMNHPQVRGYFDRAIQISPCNCFALANYAWWLLNHGLYREADGKINQALKYVTKDMRQLKSELLLYRGLVRRIRKQDDTLELKGLKILMLEPFTRVTWPLQHILPPAEQKLSSEDFALYSTIVAAILDDNKISTLDGQTRWCNLEVQCQEVSNESVAIKM